MIKRNLSKYKLFYKRGEIPLFIMQNLTKGDFKYESSKSRLRGNYGKGHLQED